MIDFTFTDTSIPTVDLGIKNTEKGHCAKTIGILKYLSNRYKESKNIKFIVIADDDTILRFNILFKISSKFIKTQYLKHKTFFQCFSFV